VLTQFVSLCPFPDALTNQRIYNRCTISILGKGNPVVVDNGRCEQRCVESFSLVFAV
jgi:hypothetical protein